MNIPYCVLKEQKGISSKAFEYHQSLAKRLFNSCKKQKSSDANKLKKEYFKQKIYKWLFGLDFKIRLKICSIYNDWFTKIMFQLLTYLEYESIIKFSPRILHENFYKKLNQEFDDENFDYKEELKGKKKEENFEENFKNFFKDISQKPDDKMSNKTQREIDFLKELRFFTINQFNDTITLSYNLLNDKEKLTEYFDTFSNCKIFSENILSIKAKKNSHIFNFSIPMWVCNYQNFTVHQLITICFEQIISIYYQIFLFDGVIPNFDIDSKINEYISMNLNMENYLGKEIKNDNFFDIKKIENEINTKKYKDLIQYYDNISENVYEIAFDRKRSEFYNDEDIKSIEIKNCINSLRKDYDKNISNFVQTISFVNAIYAFKVENFIYNIIYQEISVLYSEQNLDDLYNNIEEKPKKKKRKKKNKKKNNLKKININDKEKNKNEINDLNSEIDNAKETNNIDFLNNGNYNDNYNEDNDYNNKNNNLNSISRVESRNNINNSDDDDDNIFSNDINKMPESIERILGVKKFENKRTEYAIEMKDLNEDGKEIKKEEEKEINNPDLLKELMEMDSKEKKKKKKRRKNKKKKEDDIIKQNNIEEKINEKVIEKNENLIINENNNPQNNEEIKIKNENESDLKGNNKEEKINIIDENKNANKKHKEFFLFPIKTKKKKNKNNKNNQEKNDNKEINNESDKEDDKSKDKIYKEKISENNVINIEKKNKIFINEKTNQIEFKGKKAKNEKENKDKENSINIFDKTNKIDYLTKINKTQIIKTNNPVINNYIIIDKDSFRNSHSLSDNFNLNMNNIFTPSKNFYPPLMPVFNYPIPYQQIPNYYCLNENNDILNDLSEEILSYEKKVNNNLKILKTFKEEILNNIKNFIQKILIENNCDAQLINYGSYETKLSIEISDIDILIKFRKNNLNDINNLNIQKHIEEIISLLYNKINNIKDELNIMQINAIFTASVPVLKIKFNLEKVIPDNIKKNLKNEYLFNFEEDILQLNFDFTFTEVNNVNENKNIPSLEIVSYIQKVINIYKEIKPIILFLKRFMKINKLNSSFHGGLSSYSLFLLVYAYFKSLNLPENSVGNYLYGFLEFYSNFNFGIYSIDVNSNNPFIILNELHESGILLIDPITKLNVAKSTFKVDQIKSVFMKGIVIIRNTIYKKMIENNNFNFDNNKILFLDELFKNKNGTIIHE